MSRYEFLLFVHVSCAAIWIGGALFVQLHAAVVARANDGARMAQFAHDAGRLSERLFIPSAVLVVLAGVGLMIEGSWPWGRLWVLFALAAYAGSFLTGVLVLSPTAKGIAPAIEAGGPDSPLAQSLIRKIFRIGRAELVFLFAIVFAMTVKPTSNDLLVVGVAAVVVVAASAFFLFGGREVAPDAVHEPAA